MHKREGHTRVLLHNTTCIGFCTKERCKETQKMEKLRKLVIKQEVDILALTELNKRWSKVEEENIILTAMRKWRREGRTYATYNKLDEGVSTELYGGTQLHCSMTQPFENNNMENIHANWEGGLGCQ